MLEVNVNNGCVYAHLLRSLNPAFEYVHYNVFISLSVFSHIFTTTSPQMQES